jgi:hypothetical protein
MTLYELLLFLHIAFAIVWIGSGFLFHVLGYRRPSRRPRRDRAALQRPDGAREPDLHPILAARPRLRDLAHVEGPWSVGDLWIVLGLVGYGLTFLTGMLWIAPQSKRAAEIMARDDGLSRARRRCGSVPRLARALARVARARRRPRRASRVARRRPAGFAQATRGRPKRPLAARRSSRDYVPLVSLTCSLESSFAIDSTWRSVSLSSFRFFSSRSTTSRSPSARAIVIRPS